MDDILISIIVPVYNPGDYLYLCLNSLVHNKKGGRNIEIILIDDGSTDGSGEVCDNFAKNDDRIRVIHNSNHGVSYSRNCGIRLARGNFIAFVDSDDYVGKDYIINFVEAIKINADIYIAPFTLQRYNGSKEVHRLEMKKGKLSKDFGRMKDFLDKTWGNLYRADLIRMNNIMFDEKISLTEDTIFNFEYAKCAENYMFVDGEGYICCVKEKDSLSKHLYHLKEPYILTRIGETLTSLFNSKKVQDANLLLCNYCFYPLSYAGADYSNYVSRCHLFRRFCKGKYVAENWKRRIVLTCIQYKCFFPVYVFYGIKILTNNMKLLLKPLIR